jgi:hypothetical protein
MYDVIIPSIPVGAFFVSLYAMIYRDLKRKDA